MDSSTLRPLTIITMYNLAWNSDTHWHAHKNEDSNLIVSDSFQPHSQAFTFSYYLTVSVRKCWELQNSRFLFFFFFYVLVPSVAQILNAAHVISVTSGRKRVCEVQFENFTLAALAAKAQKMKKKKCKREGCPVNHKTRRGRVETNCRDWFRLRVDTLVIFFISSIWGVGFHNVDAPVYRLKRKKKKNTPSDM